MSNDRCLGELAAALVDCELDHDSRDRALSHITRCAGCRGEVDAQRRLKALLANQPDPVAAPDLTVRLLAVAQVAAGPNHADVVRAKAPARRVRPPARPRSFRGRAASVSALGLLVAGVAVAAGGDSDARKVRPPVATYVEEHSATTDQLGPLHDPAGNVVLAGLR